MGKQTTRDAALSRLFGNTDADPIEEPTSDPEPNQLLEKEPTERKSGAIEKPPKQPRKRQRSRGEGDGTTTVEAPKEEVAPSGYIGLGKYSRADGVVERITPYVRPDQAEALRVAVARKNDPRGRDISQIIQSLLDDAGYRL